MWWNFIFDSLDCEFDSFLISQRERLLYYDSGFGLFGAKVYLSFFQWNLFIFPIKIDYYVLYIILVFARSISSYLDLWNTFTKAHFVPLKALAIKSDYSNLIQLITKDLDPSLDLSLIYNKNAKTALSATLTKLGSFDEAFNVFNQIGLFFLIQLLHI